MRVGCEIGGRGEEDAMFYLWKEAVFAVGGAADKAAGVFGAPVAATLGV